ncbi:M60 family peptidase N-terminal accessory domain-containing protein [Mucilaginibacter antarcticus]|uniref:M60 family peptidase N-terminal accessory domain-containing protein n=1 Tax=Mucilaginibacter antarcticus TaxID=1855725 RepID=UPI00363B1CE8
MYVTLLVLLSFAATAQNTKQILLKGVDSLPMPPTPQGSSFFVTVDEQPEIIAMLRSDFAGEIFRANAIVTSRLGKGKVVLFGASAYFKAMMLEDKNVARLLKNIIDWASPGSKTRSIAVVKGIDPGFTDFLKKQHANVYTTTNLILKKNTDLLFLNTDVADNESINQIEAFVSAGGTLMFASPFSDLYINRDTTKNLSTFELGMNKLLAKAGLVNPNAIIVQSPGYERLMTDTVPGHLHITTLLPLLQSETKFSESADFFVTLALDQIFKYKDSTSAIIKKIKQTLKIPAVLTVPSPDAPVLNNTPALKAANKAAYWLYQHQQKFKEHPEAKAIGYKVFPGDVQEGASRVTQMLTIPVKVGTQGLSDPSSVYHRSHTTGLYVPAGEKVTITLSDADSMQGLKAQIGVHFDDLTSLDEFKRIPLDLVTVFNLDKKKWKFTRRTVVCYSLIYPTLPSLKPLK